MLLLINLYVDSFLPPCTGSLLPKQLSYHHVIGFPFSLHCVGINSEGRFIQLLWDKRVAESVQ